MKFNKFEDIKAWQKAGELNMIVYKLFRNCRDFSFKDQICRAAISILKDVLIKNSPIFYLLPKDPAEKLGQCYI